MYRNLKSIKIYFILFSIFITISALWADPVKLSKDSIINSGLLKHPSNTQNSLVLTAIPLDFYKSYQTLTISWSPQDLSCELYFSESPGGGELSNYLETGITGTGIIQKTPSQLGLGVGSYYCVVANTSQERVSTEFRLIVESEEGVKMNGPIGAIEDPVPTFSWQPNTGVPYYHVIVSDNPFVIEEDEDGNLQVTGAQAIWQVITPNTSIEYGAPDPSESSTLSAPPLVPGVQYNWIVMNNYGNSLEYSSNVVTQPKEFTYEVEDPLDPPTLISPESSQENDTTYIYGDEIITFEWSEIADAMLYEIYLSEIRLENGSEVKYTVFNKVTTNTFIDFSARDVLVNSNYVWKVIATDNNDNSAVSDVSEFSYRIPDGTLNIFVKNIDEVTLSYASVEVDPIEGSSDEAPLLLGEDGNIDKTLPIGDYVLTANKEGYETKKDTVSVEHDVNKTVVIKLEYSPSSIYGDVVNEDGVLINNAKVTAQNNDGEIRETTTSTGSYSLSVLPGFWSITASKETYSSENTIAKDIGSGKNVNISNLILLKNEKNLAGTVTNTSGSPLKSVNISATKNSTTIQKITNSSGNYEFIGLGFGDWSIHAEKNGYTSPPDKTVNITSSSPDIINLENIALTPQANIISGNANNSSVGLEGVTITATPSSGNQITTKSDMYGNYSINLPSGDYTLTAALDNYTSQNTHTLSLSVGKTMDGFDFTLIPNESYIKGTVTSGGSALEDVTVSKGNQSVQTNSIGNYSISVTPGTYEISVSKTGYSSDKVKTVPIGAGQTVDNINFTMSPNASVISGQVLHSGESVAEANIQGYKILSSGNKVGISSITTQSNGEYELNLLPGSYTIWADKPNFICQDSLTLNIVAGQNYENRDINIVENIAIIKGVTNNLSGENLRSASIKIIDNSNDDNTYSTISNSSGQYSINVTPEREYNITAEKSGYGSLDTTTKTLSLNSTNHYTLRMEALASSLMGTIFDQEGNKIKDANITVYNDSRSYASQSDINGKYFLDLKYGNYTLEVEKLGYIGNSSALEIAPGQSDTVNMTIEENFSTLSGIVTNESGTALEDGTVTASRSSGGGRTHNTNQEGAYTITNLLPGSYTISVNKNDYEKVTIEDQTIPAGASIEKDFQLTLYDASLKVSVDDGSSSLKDVTISAVNQETGQSKSSVTNAAGQVTIDGLSANTEFEVMPGKLNYFAESKMVTLKPGESKTISFSMQLSNSSLTGSVVYEHGGEYLGVGEAAVSALSPKGFSGNAVTSPDGSFTIEDLKPEQKYGISVSKDGYKDVAPDSINLEEEEQSGGNFVVIPNNKQIHGTVRDQTGASLADVSIIASSESISKTTTSNQNGTFSIPNLAAYTTYYVATSQEKKGWENTEKEVEIQESDLDAGIFTITINDGKITGILTDSDTEESIAGANISADNKSTEESWSKKSQPDGSYTLEYLSAGDYEIRFTKNSYQKKTVNIQLGEREEKQKNITMKYTSPVTVSGSLMDTDDRPLNNTNVYLINDQQNLVDTTNNEGVFSFQNMVLPYTTSTLSTNLPDSTYDNDVQEIHIENNNINKNLTVDLHNASISGSVKNSNTNATLKNCEVLLQKMQDEQFVNIAEFVTDSDGKYKFSNLYEGEYKLNISRSGYSSESERFTLTDLQKKSSDLSLEQIENVLSGFVGWKNRGEEPLKNVRVILEKGDQEMAKDTTSVSGGFQFEGLIYGQEYDLITNKTGFQNDTTRVLFNEETEELSLLIEMPDNTLSGSVLYNSKLQPHSKVHAQDLEGYLLTTTSDDFGDYTLQGLSGYFNVWSNNQDTSLVSHIQTVNLGSDSSIYQNLELKEAAKIKGQVTYKGEGIAGVNVIVENINNGMIIRGLTETNGNYVISGLRAGTYRIQVSLEGFTVNENIQQRELKTGEIVNITTYTLTFTNNSISGSAINQNTDKGIKNAQVILQKNNIPLDTVYTGADGNFYFTDLSDGDYKIAVSHSAYQAIEAMDITLSEGESQPSTLSFILTPKDYLVYGKVNDTYGNPISNAKIKVSNSDTSVTDLSEQDGNYSIEVGGTGIFNLFVTHTNYDTSTSTITLSNMQNSRERNIILTPQPSSICGEVKLIDQSTQIADTLNLDTVWVTLQNDNIDYSKVTVLHKSAWFCFDELQAGNYELKLEAQASINNQSYYFSKNFPELNLSIGTDTTFTPHYFVYNPNTANLTGSISIQYKDNNVALEDANVFLLDNNETDPLNSTLTNQDGNYVLNNIEPGTYRVDILADYRDESFHFTSSLLEMEDSSYTLDHKFEYILASIQIFLTEDGETPISDAKISISNSEQSRTYLTNQEGLISTDSSFHTGDPISIDISKSSENSTQFINPLPFQILFNQLKDTTLNITLPLKFDRHEIDTIGAKESIDIYLSKQPDYGGEVALVYTNLNGNKNEIIMSAHSENLLSASVPAQMKSGTVQFHFTSRNDQENIVYSNENKPFKWPINSKGILSSQYSKIFPSEPRFAFNDSVVFELKIKDDLGNSLNDQINTRGNVEWSLSDSTIGQLIDIPESNTSIAFKSFESEKQGKIKAFVRLDGVNISLSTSIEIKRMRLAKVNIDGPEEISNQNSAFLTVSTISDSGWKMTLPISVEAIDSGKGEIVKEEGGLRYYPDTSYIGNLKIGVSATDNNYDTTIYVQKEISVYQEITSKSSSRTIDSGEECSLNIPPNMLRSEGTARLYLTVIPETPAIKSKTITQELETMVYNVNSDKSLSAFNKLPGINFDINSEGHIAFWNNDNLSWEVIDPDNLGKNIQVQTLSLEEIPGWQEYGVVAPSLPLGIHKLRLAPNPFTPFDNVGNNKGLQIMFELTSDKSRYPSVTAKIYNLRGSLVRTIADNKAMLKGNYQGGVSKTLYWDGTTDNGKIARNGRYLLHIIIKDSSGKKEYLESVVLIK